MAIFAYSGDTMAIQRHLSLIVAVFFVVVLTIYFISQRRNRASLPPGPPGLPILGNILDMMKSHPWIKYAEWSKQYGSVMHVNAAGHSVIILSSPKALSDLLNQRGSIYSDRPRLVMGGELVGYGNSVPLSPYGRHLRECRKLMSKYLTPKKVEDFFQLEEEASRQLLLDLLHEPDQFLRSIRRCVAAVVLQITHGYHLTEGEDPVLLIVEQALSDFSALAVPGAFSVDLLPILKHLPRWLNFDWMKQEKTYRQNKEAFLNKPYDMVRAQIDQGIAKPSFVSSLLEANRSPTKEQDYVYRWTTGSFYGGGADTTVSAISSFFFAMRLFPTAQRKAQEEVRKVVGSNRLPTFFDRPRMPYVEALIKEVYRLNPVGPTALPHRCMKDDVYNGYLIPRGAIILANSWAVLHDEAIYPSPFEFIPERYFDKEALSRGLNPDPRKYAFGYGRRACPGQHLADSSLFIVIAMVLAVFDIFPVNENIVKPDFSKGEGYTSETISHPKNFECRIVPCSAEAAALITTSTR